MTCSGASWRCSGDRLPGRRNSQDAPSLVIYLVNLVFWSGLAVTDPRSPYDASQRRLVAERAPDPLTTAGSPDLLVLLWFCSRARRSLSWVTTPIPAKAGWLNPLLLAADYVCAPRCSPCASPSFGRCSATRSRPETGASSRGRNRIAVILLMLGGDGVPLGLRPLMSLDPKWSAPLRRLLAVRRSTRRSASCRFHQPAQRGGRPAIPAAPLSTEKPP